MTMNGIHAIPVVTTGFAIYPYIPLETFTDRHGVEQVRTITTRDWTRARILKKDIESHQILVSDRIDGPVESLPEANE